MALNPVVIGIGTEFDERGLKEAMRALGDVQRKSQTFGDKFRNVEKSFTRSGLIITGVVTGFALAINKSVEAALESQRVSRQTVALIESTGGAANIAASEVGKLAEALALKSGVDDEAIQTSLNLLLTFKQVQNVAGEGNDIFNQTAQTVLDLGNVFGSTDSAAVQLGKALSDPIRGVTALRRVGINFTESQREQIKTLVESGDVLNAQKLILAEVQSQVGGTAEATATGFGKMRVAVDNLNERFGAIFLPLLERLANFITNTVVPKLDAFIEGFSKLDAGTKQNILIFGVFVAAIGPLLLGIGLLMKAVRLLSVAFVALHTRIFFIPLAIAALIGAIALQVDGMGKGAQAADGFAIRILVAFSNILKGLSGFGNSIARTIEAIVNGFVDFHNAVIDTGQAFRRFLGIDVPEGAQELQRMSRISLPDVTFSLDGVINAARSASKSFGNMVEETKGLASQAKGLATGAMPQVTEQVDKAGNAAKKAAEKILKLDDSFRNTLRNAIVVGRQAGESLQDLGGRLLADFADKVLRLGRFTEKTAQEFDDLVSVIRDKFDDALDEGKRRLDEATNAFSNFRDEIARGIASEANFANAAQAQSESIKALEDALKQQAEAQEKVIEAQESGDEDALAKANKDLAEANRLLASARSNQRSFLDFLRVGVTQAEAFASQVTALTNAGASLQVIQQIVSLGATVGGRVAAELLAGGAAAIQEANRLLAVVDSVSQAAGIVAAKRFFQGGIDAANAFIDAVKRQIQGLNSIIDDILARLMKVFEMQNRATGGGGGGGGGRQLFTELGRGGVTQAGIEMVRQGANIPDSVVASYIISDPFNTTLEEYARQLGITGFAKGAIVNRPMMGLVGEAGPEAIIPLNRSSGMGATYNITVNAGMGANGADLGRAVVEAIRKYEKIAGQQFAGV